MIRQLPNDRTDCLYSYDYYPQSNLPVMPLGLLKDRPASKSQFSGHFYILSLTNEAMIALQSPTIIDTFSNYKMV